jgi:hypothetical protein
VLELYDAGRPALGDVVLLRHDADDVLVKGTRPPSSRSRRRPECATSLPPKSMVPRPLFVEFHEKLAAIPRRPLSSTAGTSAQRTSWAFSAGTKIIPATKESYRVYIGTCNQNSNIDSV